MAKEVVRIAKANELEKSYEVEVVKTWEPNEISYFSDIVYFKHEGSFYSMKTLEFKKIFYKI